MYFLDDLWEKKTKGLIIGGVKTMNINQTRLYITNKLQKRHIKKFLSATIPCYNYLDTKRTFYLLTEKRKEAKFDNILE